MKTQFTFKTILGLSLSFLLSFSVSAQIIADGDYSLLSTLNNEVLTSPNVFADTTSNPDFFAYMTAPNPSDANQIYTFTHLGNDVYTIKNTSTGSFLGIKDNWCGDFGNVQGRFTDLDTNTEFKITNAGIAETYSIQIAFTDCSFDVLNDPVKAFDIDGGNVGARINTFPVDLNNVNQQWKIVNPNTLSTGSFDTANNSFSIYPNPASDDVITIKSIGVTADIDVQLINVQGQLVASSIYKKEMPASTIDISNLNNGLYFIRLIDKGNRVRSTRRILVSK